MDGIYMMTKTIKLNDSTKNRLNNIKKDETYDETINRLIDFVENIQGNLFEEPVIVTSSLPLKG